MEEKKAQLDIEKKRIIIYLAVTFVITYVYEIFVITPLVKSENQMLASVATLLIGTAMFIPAICVLLTRLITKEGMANHMLKPNFKRNVKIYLFTWFGPAVLILAGCLVYFAIFPKQFDTSMAYLSQTLAAAGQESSPEKLKATMLIQVAAGVLLGPILNFVNCFGEEWGWRGYLLPKMSKQMPMPVYLLVSGVIWGLWHAPITALGHNYGLDYKWFPYAGIFAMCIFCIVIGTIFSYITIKSGSCIPAVLAHAGLNAMAGFGIYLTVDGGNPFIGPAPMGIIGGTGFIICAVFMAIALTKQQKNEQVDK